MADANRLAAESSPYLLQHAHNPVDWYPWGAEAFEAARRENKCIFLSVGYSTCYWCHVMERQSFENETIAGEMNKRFINVKVDREERPDVDQVYMTAVQLITRQGGWPMSLFLTPELKPFYGGTYFPPVDGHGRPGFLRILAAVDDAYRNRPEEVARSAEQITGLLGRMARPAELESPMKIDEAWIESLIERSTADYEPMHGGFGSAPKFPRETLLELLLIYLREKPNERLMKQLTRTLDAMAEGGIRDQLGGGFHRYSTDGEWLVPHFEIMLYDNAMLAWIYAEAYRQTEDLRYAAVARGICDFVLREMTSPEGAFYTAFDAEVDAREGLSYLWTMDEVKDVLGEGGISPAEIERFCRVYGLDQGPNFADPHHGNGRAETNILYLAEPGSGATSAILDLSLAPMRELLYAARRKRKQPSLDHKILTSWNALMIRGLAHALEVLQEEKYLKAAEAAADFLLKKHRDREGGLFRVSTGAEAKVSGFLDDYAYLIQALLALDEAGDDERRRDQAGELAAAMRERFSDSDAGGFYFNDQGATDLIVRQKIGTDSPLPSGNGVAAMAMLDLEEKDIARGILSAFAGQMDQGGEGMSALVQATMLYVKQHGAFVATGSLEKRVERPTGPAQMAGEVISLSAAWEGTTRLNVRVKVADGFHINAHEASEGFSATRLSVIGEAAGDVAGIDYPKGEELRLAFADSPVRVYSGEFVIGVRFARALQVAEAARLSLYYQACDDRACLPPVSKALSVPLP